MGGSNMPFTPVPSPPPYAEQIGKRAAEPVVNLLKQLIDEGKPVPPIPIVINAPTATDELVHSVAKVASLATSPDTLNTGVTFLSVRTAGRSALGFLYAEDKVAKTFYLLGFVFVGTAAGFSSSAVMSKTCAINKVGIVGETVGEACYQIAEEANRIALKRDNKFLPARRPMFNRRNTGSAAFILPLSNRNRVYRIIVSNVVFIVTAYGYIKIIRTTWKKARGFILKKRQLKRLKLLTKSSIFLSSILINKIRKSKKLSCNKSCLFSAV